MEAPEKGNPVVGIAMEIPVRGSSMSCSPPTVPAWLRRRLSESKTVSPSSVQEIEAKLRDADLRRQVFLLLYYYLRLLFLSLRKLDR